MTAPARAALLRALAAGLGGLYMPWALAPAHAALWTWESTVQMRAEVNDNLSLVPQPAGVAHRISLLPGVNASRQTDNAVTRIEGGFALIAESNAEDRRNTDGHLSLSQTLSDPRDTYSATLRYAQSDTFGDGLTANDVLAGRTRSTTLGASTAWSHAFTERLGGQAQLALSDTRYPTEDTGANDYRDRSLSASLNYRWDEVLTLGVSASHAYFAAASGARSTTSDSLRLTASRSLTERTSASISLGAYQTRSRTATYSLVCPLEVSLCEAGIVSPIPVRTDPVDTGHGAVFDASFNWSIDEVTAMAVSAGRELTPSGIGVVQSGRFNGTLSRAFSPTLRGTATLSQSSSSQPGALDRLRPRLRTADLAVNWSLAEDLSLSAGATVKRFDEPRAGTRARSNALSISLQYMGPGMSATR